MWTYQASDQSAAAVATVFAAQVFDPPREVEIVTGAWLGKRFHGSFRLREGRGTYQITGEGGRWWVEEVKGD